MKVSFIFWDLGHETPQLKFFHSLPSLWFCSRSLSSPSRLYFHFCLVCCFSWLPPRFLHRCHFQPLLLLLSLYFIPTCLNWNCSWNYSLAVAPTVFVCHHSSAVVSTLACLFLWWEEFYSPSLSPQYPGDFESWKHNSLQPNLRRLCGWEWEFLTFFLDWV